MAKRMNLPGSGGRRSNGRLSPAGRRYTTNACRWRVWNRSTGTWRGAARSKRLQICVTRSDASNRLVAQVRSVSKGSLDAADARAYAAFLQAAFARRDGAAVRTCSRMPQERADAVGHLRAQDVLEGACVLLDGPLIAQSQHIHEQALGQAMASNHAAGALLAFRREG